MPLEPSSPDNKTPPLWQQHFPVESAAERRRSRREFVGGAAVAGSVMACGEALQSSGADHAPSPESGTEPFVLGQKLTDMDVGDVQLFHFPHDKSPCLLIKIDEADFVAYAQKCTHLACPVVPDEARHALECPCHHGRFDLETGKPLAGPPRSPLPRVNVELAKDGTLTATGFVSANSGDRVA